MNYWIRAYDNKQYDVARAIRERGFIDWGQRNHFVVGDVVFLYATAPKSRLMFAMEVTDVNLDWTQSPNDSAYFLSEEHYQHWLRVRRNQLYVRYQLIRELHSPYLIYSHLMEHGLGGAPRSPRRLMPEVVDYILQHFE